MNELFFYSDNNFECLDGFKFSFFNDKDYNYSPYYIARYNLCHKSIPANEEFVLNTQRPFNAKGFIVHDNIFVYLVVTFESELHIASEVGVDLRYFFDKAIEEITEPTISQESIRRLNSKFNSKWSVK